MRIALSDIVLTQSSIDRKAQIPAMVTVISEGGYLPAVKLSEDGAQFRVEDGTHRMVSYILAGRTHLEYGEFEMVPLNASRSSVIGLREFAGSLI